MLNAWDALRAHQHCKARLAETIKNKSFDGSCFGAVKPQEECCLVRFIREHEMHPGLKPEIEMLRTAHATVHRVAVWLAEKRAAGEPLDPQVDFSESSNFGAATSSLVTAIWRLERKLQSLAS